MIELSEFYCYHRTYYLFVSKFKVFDVTSFCQCEQLPNAATCMAVWVRFSHPYLHLCQPGGFTASRLTRQKSFWLLWFLSEAGPEIQGRDAVSVSSTGIVPVHRRGDWRGLPVSLQTHQRMHSGLPERPVEYFRWVDCTSRPVRCKIQVAGSLVAFPSLIFLLSTPCWVVHFY